MDSEENMTKLITFMIDSDNEKVIFTTTHTHLNNYIIKVTGTEPQYQMLMDITMDALERSATYILCCKCYYCH